MGIEMVEKILNAEPISFTAVEIQELLDDELSKDPSEVDMELVEKCLDILEQAIKDEKTITEEGDKKKHIGIRKIVLVAAIISLLIAIAIPVSAKYINSNISDKIIRFYSDYFSIDLRGEERSGDEYYKGIDFIEDLKNKGFDNVILPEDMMKFDFLNDINLKNKDDMTLINTKFIMPDNNINGTVSIVIYDYVFDFLKGKSFVPKEYDCIDQFKIGNMIIVVYSRGSVVNLKYLIGKMEYTIVFNNCSFDTGINIAKSIA